MMTENLPGDDALFKTTVLRRPGDFLPGTRPEVSLHLLVKNGEGCLPRLLANVGPYVDEVVAVVNDATDRTVAVLEEYSRREDFRLDVVEVTAASHPELYLLDSPETYGAGSSLTGESCPGPFTGRPLLADWSGARNLGWKRCTKHWILFLDADDVVDDPEALWGLCEVLGERGAQVAATRYVYDDSGAGGSRSECYRERVALNCPGISWSGPVHENLRGASKTAHVQGNLVVRDMKDNAGEGVRVPGRCLKVLYHHARARGWDVEPRVLLYLAMESQRVLPDFCLALVERYLDASTWPEERAWACAMAGEVHEERKDYARASGWYERSLAEYPGSKSAYRLCRTRFLEKKWRECLYAYEVGEANRSVMHLLDDGPAYSDRSKIFVASAWEKLGEYRRSLAACEEVLRLFPELATNFNLLRDQLLLSLGEE